MMTTQYLEIRALDPLFFRDGKPFSMSEETWAEGMFLPNPSVIWGALFTALVSHKLCRFEEVDTLHLKQVLYFDKSKFLLPAPLDMFLKEETVNPLVIQNRTKRTDIVSSLKRDFEEVIFVDSEEELSSSTQHFITNANYKSYLNFKNDNSTELIAQSKYGDFLPKIGIGRSNETHTSERSSLFRVDMVEYNPDKGFGFIVEVESKLTFPDDFLIKLGAEGKTALVKNKTFTKRERGKIYWQENFDNHRLLQNEIIQNLWASDYFRVVFKSPLLLANDLLSYFPFEEFKLLSVITSKPVRIGGFNYETKSPKPMRKAYPTGTVLYFSKPKSMEISVFSEYLSGIFAKDTLRSGYNAFDFAMLSF